ncbi:ghrelin/obestatin prepropeptide precursor [Silurus meridionalis]|nr:ghrelin/obestatin prepropeptide precursor [Silurus meridionalis]
MPTKNRGDRKPPRVGRRTAVELEPPLPTEEKIMASAPFQLAVSLSETEYEEYGPVLHKMLLDVLGDPPAWVPLHSNTVLPAFLPRLRSPSSAFCDSRRISEMVSKRRRLSRNFIFMKSTGPRSGE